jgi:hypothetical protein
MTTIVLVLKDYTHRHGSPAYSNVERFLRVGMPTYEKHLARDGVTEFIVITPTAELESTKRRIVAKYPKWPWRFVPEDVLVARGIPSGWAKQQTAKVAVAAIIKTPHYLIIDDDTYLTKPLNPATDLFDDRGRAYMTKCQIDFPFFYIWSSQIIDIDYDDVQNAPFHMGITPEVFFTDVSKEIIAFLETRYGTHMKWQEHLAANKFTEYCMYWSYLIKKGDGARERLYACDSPIALYGNCTVSAAQNMAELVATSFAANERYWFSFVQSSLDHGVDAVEKEVARHI